MVGERTGRVFRLGDKVKVRVVRVNLDERKIDFELQTCDARFYVNSCELKIGAVLTSKRLCVCFLSGI